MTKDEFITKLKIFEGHAPHMYLDSVGVVTIGVGLALKNTTDAKKLIYKNRLTSQLATSAEIESDFNKVKAATKGYSASFYKQYTKIDALATSLSGEFETRLSQAFSDAKSFYPALDSLPDDVKYALVDMAFNLGLTRLSNFKNLKKHLLEGDYEAAAKESHRIGPGADRNNTIAQWIKSAAIKKQETTAKSLPPLD